MHIMHTALPCALHRLLPSLLWYGIDNDYINVLHNIITNLRRYICNENATEAHRF